MDLQENDKKKEYLKSYKKLVQQVKRSEMKMQEMRMHKMYPSVVNDGMPHASYQKDLSDYAALLDREERQCEEHNYERVKKCIEITQKIEALSNEDEKDVLMNRYIKLMKWEDICTEMNFSWKWVHKIHSRALIHFEI